MRFGFQKQLLIVGGGLVMVVGGVVLLAGCSMRMLSAVRSYVGAESLWSKGQKESVIELRRYIHSSQPVDYDRFLAAIRVPLGDSKARLELDNPNFDASIARQGFLDGGNHPDDIAGMIWLYRNFHDSRYLRAAVNLWAEADSDIDKLQHVGEEAHALVLAGQVDARTLKSLMDELDALNASVAPLSEVFARDLGTSARQIENLLLIALLSTAAILASVGCWAYFLVLRNMENSDRAMRASRDRALELSRAKSQFVANMSHEIRTPMNGVLGMLQLLLETPLDEEQLEFTRIAHHSGEALLEIINDVLDFSRIEAGKLDLRIVPFVLRETVLGVESLLKERARGRHVELCSTIDEKLPERVTGDSARLRQILMNLVGNAVKFTDRGSVQVFVMERPGERVRFEVRDTGIGIAAGVEKKLFEAFSQADGSITRLYGGTGLGLAISSQLVGLMGGEIGVESKLGLGSTFWFELRLPPATLAPHPNNSTLVAIPHA